MKKSFHILCMCISSISNAAFVGEIINNTDARLLLQKRHMNNPSFSSFVGSRIISSELVTGKSFGPKTIENNSPESFILHFSPRTKNLITGLEIPRINPMFEGNKYVLNFSLAVGSSSPQEILGFRQMGELFQVVWIGNNLRELIVSDKKIDLSLGASSANPQTLTERLTPGQFYAIEIKQVIEDLSNKNTNSLDVIIKIIDEPIIKETFADWAMPYLSRFSRSTEVNAITYATMLFEKPINEEYFKRFNEALKANEFIKNNVSFEKNDRDQSIAFNIYSDISKDEFQKILNLITSSLKPKQ